MPKSTLALAFTAMIAGLPVFAAPVPLAPMLPGAAAPLERVASGKELCEATLFGKKARLWLEGGVPVRYQWANRAALKAEMKGDVIYIAASPTATLSNVVTGQDSKGRKVLKGDWKFKSNTRDGVVFTCAPG